MAKRTSRAVPAVRRTTEDRFWVKVNKDGPIPSYRPDLGPCWQWTASTTSYGYGQLRVGDGDRMAYRWAYERYVGPVPKGMELDHLCRNRRCVNFESHLEVVTKTENILRGTSPMAINARKTHCIHGHELVGANVYIRKDRPGRRQCVACRRERRRAGEWK